MSNPDLPGEFDLIAEIFAPLAAGFPGAKGLTDDAAVIAPPPGSRSVVTADMMVAGRHFHAGDPAYDIARRLLRVNLSDLAAMGARPVAYLLTLALPQDTAMEWMREFARGLADDQTEFGVHLIGGDTTATPGPLTVSVTAMGEVSADGELSRGTAAPGDMVFVSGTIGDAALGLGVLEGKYKGLDATVAAALAERFRLPSPRLALGTKLRGFASACADVSDGLVADLGHICTASGVAAEIEFARVPVSKPAQALLRDQAEIRPVILAGGDDYELIFTAPTSAEKPLREISTDVGVAITAIGRIAAGEGVRVLDEEGREIALKSSGYRHF